MNDNAQILSGVRILDFTWVLAGPYGTRLLADYGAEVIKVQPVTTPREAEAFDRAYYATWNRNKLGVTLNMNKPEGIDLAKKLAVVSGVVIENFTPRVMENWGMDYSNLRQLKPDIIMVSMSAWGRTGPYRDRAGFAPTVHAASGLTSLTSFDASAPLGPGFSWSDHVAGLYAAMAVLAALERRDSTGEGSFIDLSETEAMAGLLGGELLAHQSRETKPEVNILQGVYPCRDGWCAVTVTGETEREKLVAITGAAEETREGLDRLFAGWARDRTADEVMSLLQSRGIAAGAVRDAAGLAADPQLKARGFFIRPPEKGDLLDACPIRIPGAPPRYDLPAPEPGRDNRYVFGEILGLDEKEISRLTREGVI